MGRIKRTKEDIKQDIATQSKVCCVCEVSKPFAEFYNFKNKSDNKSYRCKPCDDEARWKYRENNLASIKVLERERTLKFKYGIGVKDYDQMLEKQGGCCAICGSKQTRGTHSFSVDHCHITGMVRGLLCNNCNRGLGLLGDTIEGLMKAVKYLSTTSTKE